MNQAPAPYIPVVPPTGPIFLVADTETSGLNAERCELLEIAARMLDVNLRVLPDSHGRPGVLETRVQPTRPLVIGDNAEQGAIDMHQKTGLFDNWYALLLSDVENYLLTGFDANGLTGEGRNSRVHLVGRNPAFDMAFFKAKMPRFAARLHYRTIDIDTLELLASVVAGVSTSQIRQPFIGKHRALDDVDSTIRELVFFANTLYQGRTFLRQAIGLTP